MEDEILKIMDSFEIVEVNEIRNVKILEKDINQLIKANTNLADKVKDYRSDAYFLCNFIKENIQTTDYMIINLLKKYERKNYEITQNRKFNIF